MKTTFKALMIAVGILVTSMTVSLAQDYQKALAAYNKGDYATALREWKPFAEQGDAIVQVLLGSMYQRGLGVTKDYTEAVNWYREAAEQGNKYAQSNLGVTYANGQGVTQDYAEAVNWYRKAAEQGYAGAQGNLGLMYYLGNGVIQNIVSAHMWLNIAASNGQEDAVKNRGFVQKKMTASQLEKAQDLAALSVILCLRHFLVIR